MSITHGSSFKNVFILKRLKNKAFETMQIFHTLTCLNRVVETCVSASTLFEVVPSHGLLAFSLVTFLCFETIDDPLIKALDPGLDLKFGKMDFFGIKIHFPTCLSKTLCLL